MAATVTNLTSGGTTSNPGVTASIAPAANRVLLVEVAVTKTGAPAPGAADMSVSGLGLTWQQVQDVGGVDLTQEYRARRRLYWFVAETSGVAPSPGSLTITYSGVATFQEVAWSVEEVAGAVSGNNGQDAIGGTGNTSVGTGSTSITVTIVDSPVAGDITIAMAGIEQSGGTPGITSPGTAVELSNNEHTNVRHLIVGYDPNASTAYTFGPWGSTANGAGAMGIRIVAATGGPNTGTAAFSYNLDLDASGARDSEGTGAFSYDLDLGTSGARDSAGAGSFTYGLQLGTSGARDSAGAGAFSYDIDLSATGNQPGGGQAGLSYELQLDATGSRPSEGSAVFTYGLGLSGTGSQPGVPSSGTAAFSFNIRLTAAGIEQRLRGITGTAEVLGLTGGATVLGLTGTAS